VPEGAGATLVVLHYTLVRPPIIKRGKLPESACSEPVAWLYDELDYGNAALSGQKTNGKSPSRHFVHSILLSNGWEICLHFRNVSVKRPVPVIPGTAGSRLRAAAS
jgi:hypothetical protein